MSNKIIKFFNEEFGNVRGVYLDGQAWFAAKDVCKALELKNVGQACSRLDEDELTSFKMTSGRQKREMLLVNEPGLYSLVLSSRKPSARKFKRWVTHEILPALRHLALRDIARSEGKVIRRTLTDTIKKFCDYLKERGDLDRPESTWHIIFTKLANKIVGVDDKRDNLPFLKVLRLQDCEDILAREIENGMAAGLEHHDIWTRCQEKLDAWQKLINE